MVLGIDLGTTNSLIACLRDGVPTPIPTVHGGYLTPSVVSVDQDDVVLVGEAARERLFTDPLRTAGSFKRLMGSTEEVRLGSRRFRAEDLSALVLRSRKADAEAYLQAPVTEVVISVPAYFNDQQRKATRLAGELAGLTVRRLINEPTAAALLHGIHERDIDSKFLVFDLGGGTFDVSILERFSGVMEVRATGGDSFLGGDDFTEALVQWIGKAAPADARAAADPSYRAALRFAAETAKRELSTHTQWDVEMPRGASRARVTLTLAEYELACARLVERLRAPIERALRDARLRTTDLDEIVLVGGATRMPMVRRLAAQLFGRLPARHPDPDQTIALGAAVAAGLVARDAAFEELVLADVCPHSLGTAVAERDGQGGIMSDLFLPIIERNTVVPASRVRTLFTINDQQTRLRIDIYQGEARLCSKNTHLGGLELSVPPRKAGEVRVDVRLTYDVNGILDVDIDSEEAGVKRNLVIKKLAGEVSDDEIERRRRELAALRIHPRDEDENRLVLERAERLFEQLLGAERERVGDYLKQFTLILERQDPHEIRVARGEFARALDGLERGSPW